MAGSIRKLQGNVVYNRRSRWLYTRPEGHYGDTLRVWRGRDRQESRSQNGVFRLFMVTAFLLVCAALLKNHPVLIPIAEVFALLFLGYVATRN